MRFFLDKLLPGGGIRNVAILTGGTTVAQVITICSSPILTRLYSPDDFGMLAIYTGLLVVFSSISSLRYEMAIPLPEDDDDAAALVVLSLFCVFGVAMLSAIILLFFDEEIIDKLNVEALRPYLWLLSLGILLSGAYRPFNYWIIRKNNFALLAQTRLIQSISSVSVQLLGYGMGAVALILGQVASQSAGLTQLAKSTFQHRGGLLKGICFTQVWAQACRYKRFPIYTSWGGLFNVVGAQLPAILFAVLFNPATAGFYALASRVLSVPMSLVGNSIGQVYFSKAAEARRCGRIGNLVSKVHDKLAQLSMPPSFFLIFVAPEMFSFIFGSEWRQAGVFVQLLTPMLYFQFIFSPISLTLAVMERQELTTLMQALMLLLRVVALLLGAWLGDVVLAVCLFSIASSIAYILFLIVIMRVTNVAWSEIIRPTVIAFVWGTVAVLPLALADFFQVDNQAWQLLFVLISFMAIVARCCMVVVSKYGQNGFS